MKDAKQAMTAESFAKAVQTFAAAMQLPRHESVNDLAGLHAEATQMQAVLAKKEEGEKLLVNAWQVPAESYAKAMQTFADAMAMPRHESVNDLAGLHSEAKDWVQTPLAAAKKAAARQREIEEQAAADGSAVSASFRFRSARGSESNQTGWDSCPFHVSFSEAAQLLRFFACFFFQKKRTPHTCCPLVHQPKRRSLPPDKKRSAAPQILGGEGSLRQHELHARQPSVLLLLSGKGRGQGDYSTAH